MGDFESEMELRHDKSPVSHGEYDAETEDIEERLDRLETQIAELKRQIEEFKKVKP